MQKPYTPDTLAKRWDCSAASIRQMIRREEIGSFQIGKLTRIPVSEVERYECQNIPSQDTVENGPSPLTEAMQIHTASRLARMTAN